MDKFSVIIPARGGSKGVPGKNLKLLQGKTLVEHTIEHALVIAENKDIFLLSDDPSILEIGAKRGVRTDIYRDPNTAQDHSRMFDLYKYFYNFSDQNNINVSDNFVCMMPTFPFRSIELLNQVQDAFLSGADWILSVNQARSHPSRLLAHSGSDLYQFALDYPKSNVWANRQELSAFFEFNGAIIGGRRRNVLGHDNYNIHFGCAATVFGIQASEMDRFDIDTAFDFYVAECIAGSLL